MGTSCCPHLSAVADAKGAHQGHPHGRVPSPTPAPRAREGQAKTAPCTGADDPPRGGVAASLSRHRAVAAVSDRRPPTVDRRSTLQPGGVRLPRKWRGKPAATNAPNRAMPACRRGRRADQGRRSGRGTHAGFAYGPGGLSPMQRAPTRAPPRRGCGAAARPLFPIPGFLIVASFLLDIA